MHGLQQIRRANSQAPLDLLSFKPGTKVRLTPVGKPVGEGVVEKTVEAVDMVRNSLVIDGDSHPSYLGSVQVHKGELVDIELVA